MKTNASLPIQFKSFDDSKENKGSFTGYVSVFENVDFGGDIVDSSAFDAEIADNPSKIYPLLHGHYSDNVVGGFTITKDNYGLLMDGFFNLEVQQGKEDYSNAKAGVLTGFSIGYRVKKYENNDDGTRRLLEIKLYEGSIVTFPMNDEARLTGIKQLPQNEREFEYALREVGFSKNKAKAITCHGFKYAELGEDQVKSSADECDAQNNEQLANELQGIKQTLEGILEKWQKF